MKQTDPFTTAFGMGLYFLSTSCAAATLSSPLAFIGMPAPVAFMAFAGSAAGLILQPPDVSRRKMLALTVIYAMVAACMAMVVGMIPHFEWAKDAGVPAAFILALFAQTLIPAGRDRLKNVVSGRGATDQGGT